METQNWRKENSSTHREREREREKGQKEKDICTLHSTLHKAVFFSKIKSLLIFIDIEIDRRERGKEQTILIVLYPRPKSNAMCPPSPLADFTLTVDTYTLLFGYR